MSVTTVKRSRLGKRTSQQNSAVEMAAAMGIDLLTEEQYRELAEARRLRHQDFQLGQDTA